MPKNEKKKNNYYVLLVLFIFLLVFQYFLSRFRYEQNIGATLYNILVYLIPISLLIWLMKIIFSSKIHLVLKSIFLLITIYACYSLFLFMLVD